ncbi:MAG TPA: FkbM family methyltransferase [Pirellulales bacterium]|nr:FkbM family methyltransferase [Pirellulales bacterium]
MTETERTICRFIDRPPAALYDIGVGLKSEAATLAAIYPAMHIFGCEPNPETFMHLRDFPGTVVEVAIGGGGRSTLYYDAGHPMSGSLFCDSFACCCRVDVWTLDLFDAVAGRPADVLLWMDIEGGELAALESGPELLDSRRAAWINVEERIDGLGYEPGALCEFLDTHNYQRMLQYAKHPTHNDAIYVRR